MAGDGGRTRIIKIKVQTSTTAHEQKMKKMSNSWKQVSKDAKRATRLMGRELALVAHALGSAATAGGALGLVMVGMAATTVGAAYATVKLGIELVKLTDNARELKQVANDYPQFIDGQQVDTLIEADDAMEALKLQVKGAGASLAVEFAPAIETVSTVLVAGALIVKDFSEEIVDAGVSVLRFSGEVIERWVNRMVNKFIPSIFGAREALLDLLSWDVMGEMIFDEVLGDTIGTMDKYMKAAGGLIDTYEPIEKGAKSAASGQRELNAALFEAAMAADDEVINIYNTALEDTRSAAFNTNQELAITIKRLNELEKEGGDAEFLEVAKIEAFNRSLRDTNAAQEAWGNAASTAGDQVVSAFDDVIAKAEKTPGEVVGNIASMGTLMLNSMEQTMTNIGELSNKNGEKQLKRAARRQKAFAIGSAIMSGAQAAVAGFVPPPIGFGPIGGFAFLPFIAAQVATQIAVISKAEKKHAGGGINRTGGMSAGEDLAPDEVSITGKDGEFMMNGMGRSAAGDRNLEALNRGESAGGPPVIAMQMDHRYFSEFVGRDIRLHGSQLGMAINQSKGIGYRNG